MHTVAMHKEKGFTLVELLITVAIIGILAAIAVPMYTGTIKRSARSEAYSNLQTLRLLEEQYFADHGCYHMDTASPPVCDNVTVSGVANIQVTTFLPGFQPGADSKLNFSYQIVTTAVGGADAAAFTATATGKNGSRVAAETYTINNQNVRTGW
jgi:type IV pilus assembly protein PilE